MSEPDPIKVGAEIEVAHPFVRSTYTDFDGERPYERPTWRPGTRGEMIPPDDSEMVADGIGTQIVTVVSIHKPGPFPARVFFTRRWRDPDGREFGKNKLHIKSTQGFRSIINGFRHEYRLIESAPKLVAAE